MDTKQLRIRCKEGEEKGAGERRICPGKFALNAGELLCHRARKGEKDPLIFK
jgi:hypothetical protein